MNYLLRIEAVNLNQVTEDINQLSVIRGGSLQALQGARLPQPPRRNAEPTPDMPPLADSSRWRRLAAWLRRMLPTPAAVQPIQVEPNERVAILDEVSDFAVRVRKLDDGAIGIVPAWDIEDPLERLARKNMEFNEIVSRHI